MITKPTNPENEGKAAETRRLGAIGGPWLVGAVIAACTALAAGLRFYQLSRAGYLLGATEYDDGVTFGNALRLVSGVVPYRDFVNVHPPGATLLMAPVALVGKTIGTAHAMAIARLLTAAADTACAALLGLLVRHRGAIAAGVASGLYAVYPDALVASRTFMLEPWLNLFILIGMLLVFQRGAISDSVRRLALGGAAFGFALAVKVWAIGPLVLLALLLARRPRRLAALSGGTVAGFGLPVLPFLLMAPGAFVTDALTTQFVRSGLGHGPPQPRLLDMAGGAIYLEIIAGVIVVAGLIFAVFLAMRRPGHERGPAALDWYAMSGLAAVVAMLLWSAPWFPHYGAFAGPFLALVLAWASTLLPRARIGLAAFGLLALAALGGAATHDVAVANGLPMPWGTRAQAARLIPPGACVFTNDVSLTISAERFYSTVPGCPVMVDSYGTWLAMTDGRGGKAPWAQVDAANAQIRDSFSRATYVWLVPGQIDWTRGLRDYFYQHFRFVGLPGVPQTPTAPAGGLYIAR